MGLCPWALDVTWSSCSTSRSQAGIKTSSVGCVNVDVLVAMSLFCQVWSLGKPSHALLGPCPAAYCYRESRII